MKDNIEQEYDLALKRLGLIYQIESDQCSKDIYSDSYELKRELSQLDQSYFGAPEVTRHASNRDTLWMLGIDAQVHHLGKMVYDLGLHYDLDQREKHLSTFKYLPLHAEYGYLNAIETAIAFTLRTAGEPLTTHFILKLHHIAGYKVYCAEQGDSISNADRHLQSFQAGQLFISPNRCTEAGKKKIEEWQSKCESNYLAPALDEFIHEYHTAIKAANGNPDKILLAISDFAWQFDHLHPFRDGNIRTVNLLIMKLLIENNLPPTLLNDPNVLDTHSPEEVVTHIKEGQERYTQRIQQGVPSDSKKLPAYIDMLFHAQTNMFDETGVFMTTAKKLCDSFADGKQVIAEHLLQPTVFNKLRSSRYLSDELFQSSITNLFPEHKALIGALEKLRDLHHSKLFYESRSHTYDSKVLIPCISENIGIITDTITRQKEGKIPLNALLDVLTIINKKMDEKYEQLDITDQQIVFKILENANVNLEGVKQLKDVTLQDIVSWAKIPDNQYGSFLSSTLGANIRAALIRLNMKKENVLPDSISIDKIKEVISATILNEKRQIPVKK